MGRRLGETFWRLLAQKGACSMGSEAGAGVRHFFWLPWQPHTLTEATLGPTLTARPSGRRLVRGRQGYDSRHSPGPCCWFRTLPALALLPVHRPAPAPKFLQLWVRDLPAGVDPPESEAGCKLAVMPPLSPSPAALLLAPTCWIWLPGTEI